MTTTGRGTPALLKKMNLPNVGVLVYVTTVLNHGATRAQATEATSYTKTTSLRAEMTTA